MLCIFHTEAQKADTKAFTKLMEHIKELDEQHSTILMVQVENEVGLLGNSRDGRPAAEQRFHDPVPLDSLEKLHVDWEKLRPELQENVQSLSNSSKGLWAKVFGPSR